MRGDDDATPKHNDTRIRTWSTESTTSHVAGVMASSFMLIARRAMPCETIGRSRGGRAGASEPALKTKSSRTVISSRLARRLWAVDPAKDRRRCEAERRKAPRDGASSSMMELLPALSPMLSRFRSPGG